MDMDIDINKTPVRASPAQSFAQHTLVSTFTSTARACTSLVQRSKRRYMTACVHCNGRGRESLWRSK
jgi:hypothetical protein